MPKTKKPKVYMSHLMAINFIDNFKRGMIKSGYDSNKTKEELRKDFEWIKNKTRPEQ